jgi:hypothetical protein
LLVGVVVGVIRSGDSPFFFFIKSRSKKLAGFRGRKARFGMKPKLQAAFLRVGVKFAMTGAGSGGFGTELAKPK